MLPPAAVSDMDRLQALGVVLSVLGVAGYLVALWAAYPGRAFTITSFMVGVTLIAMGGGPDA